MIAEACPDCGRPKWDGGSAFSDRKCARQCGYVCGLVVQLAQALAKLATSEFENAAWRALSKWENEPGKFRVVCVEGSVDGEFRLGACTEDEREVIATGDTPQAAAISLATKLGLIGGKT